MVASMVETSSRQTPERESRDCASRVLAKSGGSLAQLRHSLRALACSTDIIPFSLCGLNRDPRSVTGITGYFQPQHYTCKPVTPRPLQRVDPFVQVVFTPADESCECVKCLVASRIMKHFTIHLGYGILKSISSHQLAPFPKLAHQFNKDPHAH
jgi:hypothetical protein